MYCSKARDRNGPARQRASKGPGAGHSGGMLVPGNKPVLATSWPNLEPNRMRSVAKHPTSRERRMRDYRAYILGFDGHRFIRADEFLSNHPDDATAMEAAKVLVDGHDVELWDCGRLVARFSRDGEICSPELAPSLVISATPSYSSRNSVRPAQPISLRRASEGILTAASRQ
jgi:hypothetical protein